MGKKLVNDKQNGLHVTIDNMPELLAALKGLTDSEVLVGFPEETSQRDDPESQASGMTNASLAYIHDNGAPEANIPARPFMLPGMNNAMPEVTTILSKAGSYALRGQAAKVGEGFERAGMAAVKGIRDVILAGIPPALADSTLAARARKGRRGAKIEIDRRAKGLAPQMALAIPLLDSGEMIKALSFVVRKRNRR